MNKKGGVAPLQKRYTTQKKLKVITPAHHRFYQFTS